MKKLAYLSGALLAALSVAEAQNLSATREPGTAAQTGGMLQFGRYTCPTGGSCYDPHGNKIGEVNDPTAFVEESFSARRGIFGLTGSGTSPAVNNTILGWQLGPFPQAKGQIGQSELIDVGTRDPAGSSNSSQAAYGQVGGPQQDRPFQTSGNGLGTSKKMQGMLELSELIDVGVQDPSTKVSSIRHSNRGSAGQAKQPSPHRQNEGPKRLGQFTEISLGPLPGAEPLVEEDPAIVGLARKVVLYGRPGTAYALYVLPQGSSSGASILVAEGMLFGEDPAEEPRTYVLRVPASFGVLLMPIE